MHGPNQPTDDYDSNPMPEWDYESYTIQASGSYPSLPAPPPPLDKIQRRELPALPSPPLPPPPSSERLMSVENKGAEFNDSVALPLAKAPSFARTVRDSFRSFLRKSKKDYETNDRSQTEMSTFKRNNDQQASVRPKTKPTKPAAH